MRTPNEIQDDIDYQKEKLQYHTQRFERRMQPIRDKIEALNNELKSSSADYLFCKKCGKYSLKSDIKVIAYNSTKVETVYHDAGYGDDDELADVTRRYITRNCPLCGEEIDREDFVVSTSNRRTRR